MLARRKFEIAMLSGAVMILAAIAVAVPVSAAAVPSLPGEHGLYPATGNASATPAFRNGDFVFWAASGDDLSAAAATTIRAITPKPIGPNGISVGSLTPGFAWGTVLGATEYRLDIYADVGLSQVVASVTTPVPAASLVTPLEAGRDYYWTVRVTQPDVSQHSWASFNVSPQAPAPVVQVTTAAASRPRAAYSGGDNMIPQPAVLRFEADVVSTPEPIVINLPAYSAPVSNSPDAVLPVILVIGVLLVVGVLTLLLRPYVPD